MAKPFRIGELVHLFSLSVWFGCLAMTGAAAGILFPTVRDLNPTSPLYAGYPGDHWLIIAGHVGAKLFAVCDGVQLVCATLALLTLGLSLAALKRNPGSRPWPMLVRSLVLSVAVGLVAYELFILAPRMQSSMQMFWDNAAAGDVAKADKYRELFDQDHPTASSVMGATTVFVLVAWFFSAFSLAGIGEPGCGGNCACRKRAGALDEPALSGARG
ncbi:MAG: hypothetical protein ACOYN0_16140 [Phycisphaerales bacterium]